MDRSALPCLLFALAACSAAACQAAGPEAPPAGSVATAGAAGDVPRGHEREGKSDAAGAADAYRGVLEPDLLITMRLQRDGESCRGAYFYDAKGIDIALTGTLGEEGALSLTETASGKQTGAFTGQRGPGGTITGTWTDAKTGASRPFRLDPIERRAGAPVVIRKRWFRYHRLPRVPTLKGAALTQCHTNLAYPEVFGLANPRAEAVINDKLRRALLRDRYDEPCDELFTLNGSYAIHANRGGVLSVSFTWDRACVECDHATFGGAVVNVLVDTGADLPIDAILARGKRPLITELLRKPVEARIAATEGAAAAERGALLTAFVAGDYVLEEKGLRLIAFFKLQHGIQALDAEFGVVLPWTTVAPLLDPKSPAAAVWSAP